VKAHLGSRHRRPSAVPPPMKTMAGGFVRQSGFEMQCPGNFYASSRPGFNNFQASVFNALAIFSMLSTETFRSHRSTELT